MRRLRELPRHWLEIVVGTVFWCLLWGGVAPSDVLGGIAAGALIAVLFPLPRVGNELTLRPIALVVLVGRFLFDMVASALQVAWYAVRPSGPPASSVIAVPLRSRSDLFLTATGMMCTLIPGSVVVEAQRSTGTLFLHSIGTDSVEEAERVRRQALDQEARLLRALGRRSELEEAGLA